MAVDHGAPPSPKGVASARIHESLKYLSRITVTNTAKASVMGWGPDRQQTATPGTPAYKEQSIHAKRAEVLAELDVSATSRKWSTVTKIVEFVRQGRQ